MSFFYFDSGQLNTELHAKYTKSSNEELPIHSEAIAVLLNLEIMCKNKLTCTQLLYPD